MKFGYARVSTTDQNLSTQIDAINKYGVDKIFFDKISGKNMERKEFIKLLEQLRKDDTLVVSSLSRLGRKTKELIEWIEESDKKETVVATKTTAKKYQVIAGSLRRSEDADRMLADLKKQGFKNASVSYVKGRYYYVNYGSFNDMTQAQKYMNEMNKKNPGTWVRTEN